MTIDDNHWLTDICRSPCVNFDSRPGGAEDISLIVIHAISLPAGCYGNNHVEQLFDNRLDCSVHPDFEGLKDLKVSAHLFITRAGDIIQFVAFDARAWHAGKSCFEERDNCNDFSIGIELEGVDDDSFEQVQYRQLSKVCLMLLDHYPGLTKRSIRGHSDIAVPVGRKTDPGSAFDWQGFHLMLLRDHPPAYLN